MFHFFHIRPDLSLWVLPAALLFIIVLSLIVISQQIIKVAVKNPVETLSYE